jgi:hypothetical protein
MIAIANERNWNETQCEEDLRAENFRGDQFFYINQVLERIDRTEIDIVSLRLCSSVHDLSSCLFVWKLDGDQII